MLNVVESRVANPVRLADWNEVEEGQGVVCACCGWSGRLGQCPSEMGERARTYSCGECGMMLVARVLPAIVPVRLVLGSREWRSADRMAVNF